MRPRRRSSTAHVFTSSTVRGAAREVATAGFNETMRTSGYQQRPVN